MQPRFLHEFFERAWRDNPEALAVEVPRGSGRPQRICWTYDELARRAAALAGVLRPHLHEEAMVAILLPRGEAELYAAQIGSLLAGAAYTALEPDLPDERMRFIIEDSRPLALLTNAAGAARLRAAEIEVGLIVDVNTVPIGHEIPWPEPASWLARNSLAYVIYTSGTTGRPKGVLIEHRSIVNLVASDLERFGLGAADRVAQNSSAAYDSSLEEVWLALAAGAAIIVLDAETVRSGPDLVPWLRRERISVLCPPPTLLRATGCRDPRHELPDLRFVYVGGEALPEDLAWLWAGGRRLENGYGPTECTVTVMRAHIREGDPITIGKPVSGHDAWVVNEKLEPLSGGESGELVIAGPGLARGYLNQPAVTSVRFPVHQDLGRIYRTGDLVRCEPGGNFSYLGRIDSQVKLRGHRVELEEIEVALAGCPGVREAACTVQGSDGNQELASLVVPQDSGAPPPVDSLKRALQEQLPEHMIPSRFGFVDALPTTTGGKLNRQALPVIAGIEPSEVGAGDVPIAGTIEHVIAAAFRQALKLPGVCGRDADFFDVLGGTSLSAAITVSILRQDLLTAPLTVRDIYELRCARALAECAEARAESMPTPEQREVKPVLNPAPAALVQGLWIFLELLLLAVLIHISLFLLLPFFLRGLGLVGFLVALPFLVSAVALLFIPVSVSVAVAAKKVLIGRYGPLRAPVRGSFFLRNWMMQQMVGFIPWGLIQGTVFQNMALRALGARIGRRVHIHRGVDLLSGGWDLLEIGDDVTISQDAALRLVELEDGHVIVGPVTIGDGATLDVRAGVSTHTRLGARAYLGPLASVPRGGHVPDGERWDGVPALSTGTSPPREPTTGHDDELDPGRHGLLLILVSLAASLILGLPMLGLFVVASMFYQLEPEPVLRWIYQPVFSSQILMPLFGLILVGAPLGLVLQALFLRVIGPVEEGIISRWSGAYVRVWMKTGTVQAAGRWLSGTLFWPTWLRLAGMRVGKGCEISTIIDVVPELIEIGPVTFFADGVYLGGPRIHRGSVHLERTRLERNSFLGNHVVVPAGQSLPSDILIGVCTVADDECVRPGSSWFGHPPFELPRREIVEADRNLTHDPGLLRYGTRVFWELLRFALPVPPTFLVIAWLAVIGSFARSFDSVALLTLLIGGATWGATLASCVFVLALKWILLGRVRSGQHPFWSCWCSRWDFLYVAWGSLARPILARLESTPFLVPYLRAMGCRIGSNVVLGSGFAQVVDPDMINIESEATFTGLFQAHSFEDRVLKIEQVHVRAQATVCGGAVLFYGADVGRQTKVTPHGVVMKHEHLTAGLRYEGCPTQPAANAELNEGD